MKDSIPSSPAEWHNWATSPALNKIPAKASREQTEVNLLIRDVLVELGTVKLDESDFTFIYSDVLALSPSPGPTLRLTLPKLACVSVYARVVTSDQPITLELSPSDPTEEALVVLYATYVDQPVSVSVAGQEAQTLNLGALSGNVGVAISTTNGQITVTYMQRYSVPDLYTDGELHKLLSTQLRIASTLFWTQPSVASALAWHVVNATAYPSESTLLNVQASALQQQINVGRLCGPGVSYAPVLKLEYYKNTLATVLDAGSDFEAQYDRFTDNETSVDDQLKIWDSMLEQAQNTITMQQTLANDAKLKWTASQQILLAAQTDLRHHQDTLEQKAEVFRRGIEKWKEEQIMKAVFNIFKAIVTFGVAIGAMCIGDPEPAAEASVNAAGAIKDVEEAAEAASAVTKIISSDTLKQLDEIVEKLGDLLSSTIENVEAIIAAEGEGEGSLSPFPASPEGNEDLTALAGIAAWDKWTLDIEEQMKFPVDQNIDGASAYLLELRKHAIDGKLTTQSSAQTIKAGQEYVQVQLALQLAQSDLARLQELRDSFQGEKEQLEAARLHFYDRLDAMRTSVLIELRNLVWAFKFCTLTDSQVTLDPLNTMAEYKADLSLLVQEVERWQEGFASDKAPIHFQRDINDPSFKNIAPDVLASLQKDHAATFALAPDIGTKSTSSPYISGPFTGGSGFRVFGMRAYVNGVVPKPEALLKKTNTALIWVKIRTSGVYQDIREDGQVFGFTSMVQERQFKYRIDAQGTPLPDEDGIEVDSIIASGDHMDPPPFTQWSVAVQEPEKLDWTALSGLTLEWKGEAYMS
ncbi:uncharacterized protein SCHCODRAFT_02625241 [Schizophyllum commune H4-8]|uniref:Uncharacterized protein n=1 Tax=Schizophyllum commune (strain H4-8 / FGSC 9210) TaxID=578458 RepID=D8Q5Q5_SCHCM|nr:uncharacterized protein SCHCODRAFT_02625241 [Schizophyllum commune H4-8]KAI5892077.1 hypothetical protein SCHCODRAFT_02625241 [Schizophyllum commune H4-8]